MIRARIAVIMFLFPFCANAASESDLCVAAAINAATQASIPTEVLRSLSLTETGRSRDGEFAPWPWTVNMEGKGYWFDTRTEAVAFVTEAYEAGARSFDIGCFQINHRWHGQAFTSFDQMFDPARNAEYAAEFLTSLLEEGGSWSEAAGAYHSKTDALAEKYRERFDRILASLSGEAEPDLPVVIAAADTQGFSTWNPFFTVDGAVGAAVNGSLASSYISTGSGSLLVSSNGALF